MPQTSNLLSFVPASNSPVPISELGPRLSPPEHPPNAGPEEFQEDAALRKIAEAALGATGASGAALALRRGGEVVCLARAGEMAPPLGARLDGHSGISGECLREGQALRCEDTETDGRVDADACRSLGLRSLAVAAVRENGQITGILEVFSPQPSTFSERHLEFLRQLAELVVESPAESPVESAVESPVESPQGELLKAESVKTVREHPVESPPDRQSLAALRPATLASSPGAPATQLPGDVNIAAYMAAHEKAQAHASPRIPKIVLVGLAMLLVTLPTAWYFVRRAPSATSASGPPPPVLSSQSNTLAPLPADAAALGPTGAKSSPEGSGQAATNTSSSKAVRDSLTNAASLDRIASETRRVTKPLRVVRSEPAAGIEAEIAPALPLTPGDGKPGDNLSSLLNTPVSLPQRTPPISQGVEGGELETRIGAIYPAQARAVGQHGTVVLDALIGEDGSVRDVRVVSGPPLLRQAAVDAVRRWKYKPYRLNGKAVATQTQVKLEFKLQ